jgi:hypothetical protein
MRIASRGRIPGFPFCLSTTDQHTRITAVRALSHITAINRRAEILEITEFQSTIASLLQKNPGREAFDGGLKRGSILGSDVRS